MVEDTRIADILGDWYDRLDRGEQVSQEEMIQAHPDLGDELRAHFEFLVVMDESLREVTAWPEGAPRQIGDYRILREIGRGGMGVVYEAEQTSLGRRVALKVLSPSVTSAAQAILRFEREARAAGKLHHPNIAPIYGMGKDRGFHYYAMEMVDGRSLGEVISDLKAEADEAPGRSGPFGTTTQGREHFVRLAEAVAGVAEALHAAHEEGVVHRDVKPTNLLLASDGTLKLVDFGLARLAGEGASMTVTGQILGTPHYMSPEQAMARQVPIDYRTDIYSLGATLYEALTLETPFTGDSLPAVCSAILNLEPVLPRKANPRIPQDLETIVLKAMEKDRERRYASAEEMAKDLRRFAVGMPIRARRIGPVMRAWRKVKRNKIRTALVAAVALLAVGGALVTSRMGRESDRRRELEYASLCARGEAAIGADLASDGHGRPHPSRKHFTEAIALDPERPEAYVMRAMGIGSVEDKLADLEAAKARGFHGRSYHLLRAGFLQRSRRWREAEEELAQAAAFNEETALALYAESRFVCSKAEWKAREPWFVTRAIDLVTGALERPDATGMIRFLALRHRATLRMWKGDHESALEDLLAVKALGGGSIRMRASLASVWRLTGHRETGDRLFEEVLSEVRELGDSSVWMQLILALRDAERLEELVAACEECVRIGPGAVDAMLMKGWALRGMGKLTEALESIDHAIDASPDDAQPHLHRACVLMSLEQYGEALEASEHAIELDPCRAFLHLARGNALRKLGEFEEAAGAYTEAIRLDPELDGAHSNRGALYCEQLDRPADALRDFERALELVPRDECVHCARLHFNRGRALFRLQRFEDAVDAYTESLKLDPGQLSAHGLRGGILCDRLHRYEEARRDFEKCVELAPDLPVAHFNLGNALRGLGRNDEAVKAYETSLHLRPSDLAAIFNRALSLQALDRHEEALKGLDQASRLIPGRPQSLLMKSFSLIRLGREEEAFATIERAVKLGGDQPGVLNNAACALIGSPDPAQRYPERAIPLARRGVQLAPDDPYCLSTLGEALFRSGEHEAAIQTLEKSAALWEEAPPPPVSTALILAMAHWQLGKEEQAAGWFSRATAWMEEHESGDDTVKRLRAEAAEMLGVGR